MADIKALRIRVDSITDNLSGYEDDTIHLLIMELDKEIERLQGEKAEEYKRGLYEGQNMVARAVAAQVGKNKHD